MKVGWWPDSPKFRHHDSQAAKNCKEHERMNLFFFQDFSRKTAFVLKNDLQVFSVTWYFSLPPSPQYQGVSMDQEPHAVLRKFLGILSLVWVLSH